MLAARQPGAPLVHEHWGDNLFLTTSIDVDFEAAKAKAAVFGDARAAHRAPGDVPARGPRRGRAVGQRGSSQLVVTTSTQQPHIVRSGLAECLGLDEGQIRVIAPDVGGGFGYKGILLPEEVALAWATRKLGRPLRWLEDRRENLTANANCREHHYMLTAYADADGRLLALDCEATVDSGAYSAYPFSACLEGGQIGSILPGLYDFPHYRCRTYSVATNKPPILPYRGVARTGVCFALEVTLDALARKIGIEPNDAALQEPGAARADAVRQHRQAPFRFRRLSRGAAPGDRGHRLRQGARAPAAQASRTDAASASASPCTPSRPATAPASTPPGASRSCRATSSARRASRPTAALELRIGAHSHGQGLETTLSQVAHSILGVPHDRIKLVHGDTARDALLDRHLGLALHDHVGRRGGGRLRRSWPSACCGSAPSCCRPRREDVRLEDGEVVGPSGRIAVADVARTWYRRPQDLPADVDPGGLEVTAGYKAKRDTGTFSYAAHAAVVAVDPETGEVEILDYVVVEDGGVLVNPMIVDGQIYGGVGAGHRHRALRGDALTTRRASRSASTLVRLPAARPDRGAGDPHRAHGDALALHALRPEGPRRGRRDRAARRHHQRRQRRAARRLGAELLVSPDHAAPHRRGDRRARARPKAAA